MSDSKKRKMQPESLMMSYGYKPELSEGAIKCPIFQTSTFVFKSAEEGKAFFELAYGLREKGPTEEMGLIYSRLNNPDLEILENRLTLWDEAEACAVFESGMSAISTILLEFLNPGDYVIYSNPTYGGTYHFMKAVLSRFGIKAIPFQAYESEKNIINVIESNGIADKVKMIYIETPANPTNALVDIEACRKVADRYSKGDEKVYLAVDNTYMGPLWQHPLKHGADLVVYSATKYIGGHSDVIAGAVLGNNEVITRVKTLRTFLGNMAGPWTGWLLMRSLETLKVRMTEQAENARKVAEYLQAHPKVKKVYYLGFLNEKDDPENYRTFKKQLSSAGAMISFEIDGGEKEAFRFLNALELMHLAVSLGSTESLVEHPSTMTHSDVTEEDKALYGITDSLIRLSVGVENPDDLIADIEQALQKV
ncbi:MAG: cystathionine gamma-synthase family protein [Salibacteraceae bacterium]